MARSDPAAAYTVETGGNVHGFRTYAAAWAFVEQLETAGGIDWSMEAADAALTPDEHEVWVTNVAAECRPNGTRELGW